MKVKDLKKSDRPRERLIREGSAALSDVELLAILLGSGTKNKDVFMIATEILKKSSIQDLKNLSYQKLSTIEGIKQAKASLLMACFEIAKRSNRMEDKKLSLDTPDKIYSFVYADIYLLSYEIVISIYVDCKLRPIKKKIYTSEGAHSVSLTTKGILADALEVKAYGLLLVHNHPSGEIEPSYEDIESTMRLKELSNALEVFFLDHLIVSSKNYFSFLENGLLNEEVEYSRMGENYEKDFQMGKSRSYH
ncbi:MAG: DNA repair protein RadC [Anaeroplasmataceae bacterium]|nr:DNA repair protein RadC [Anaeroplasmataceae bacterium]